MSLKTRTYSTPRVAPLYPAPPIRYHNASFVAAMLGEPPAITLPHGIAASEGNALVIFAHYPQTDIGPYSEVLLLTPVLVGNEVGMFCPLIYVDSDVAMAAGREIWGFPKKLAQIRLDVGAGGDVSAVLRRGRSQLGLEGSLTTDLDPDALATTNLPIFNEKIVPSVDGTGTDVSIVTAVSLDMTTKRGRLGSGRLIAVSSDADPFAAIVPERSDIALSWILADSVLPAGRFATQL